jgi:hypothetical protein
MTQGSGSIRYVGIGFQMFLLMPLVFIIYQKLHLSVTNLDVKYVIVKVQSFNVPMGDVQSQLIHGVLSRKIRDLLIGSSKILKILAPYYGKSFVKIMQILSSNLSSRRSNLSPTSCPLIPSLLFLFSFRSKQSVPQSQMVMDQVQKMNSHGVLVLVLVKKRIVVRQPNKK